MVIDRFVINTVIFSDFLPDGTIVAEESHNGR